MERAAVEARSLGADTLQIFSASPRMWRAKPPDAAQVKLFKSQREQHDLCPLVIHDSYLINLAAPPSEVREKSIDGFQGEIERALVIGAEYLVAHPGNYKGLTPEQGMLNVAEAMVLAWRNVDPVLAKNPRLTILLENTAGRRRPTRRQTGRTGHYSHSRQAISRYPGRLLSRHLPLLCGGPRSGE